MTMAMRSEKVPENIQKGYSLHANGCVIKPVNLDEYIGVV